MARIRKEYLVDVADDGLPAAIVGPWAAEKYRRLAMYAEIFSTGMKNRWPNRIYLDLFAGSGHAIIKNSGRRVLTSPLLALRVPDKFAKYIFCDSNPDYLHALAKRASASSPDAAVAFVEGDANAKVDEISSLIPRDSSDNRVLCFAFVDPFGLDAHFASIRSLAAGHSMDFLILLALGMDANRNWELYLKPNNQKVSEFLGDPRWRDRWRSAKAAGFTPIRFLATEYVAAMRGLGYLTTTLDQMIEVKTYENNMRLYYLAFFSKNDKGYKFWADVQKYSTDQLGLALG